LLGNAVNVLESCSALESDYNGLKFESVGLDQAAYGKEKKKNININNIFILAKLPGSMVGGKVTLEIDHLLSCQN